MDYREQAKVSFLAKICPEVWQGRDFKSFQFLNVDVCQDSIFYLKAVTGHAHVCTSEHTEKKCGQRGACLVIKVSMSHPLLQESQGIVISDVLVYSSSFISLIHSAFNHFTKKKFCQGLKRNSVEHLFQLFLDVTRHCSEREVCQIVEGCGTNPGQGWKGMKMQLKVDGCSLG